jgi:aspartyl-tRNA(Asn)/glutamyl-tRNA(Gln) amidotransferase subunit B
MMNDVLRLIRERGIAAGQLRLRPEHLVEIIRLVESNSITAATGKLLLEKVEESGAPPAEIVAAEGLAVVSDDQALGDLAAEVLAGNPGQVASYKAGKATLIGWFVGQVMRKTGGKADPQRTRAILEDLLSREDASPH